MKVLVATDGSECARHAIAEAKRLLALKDAEVHVVSVAPLPPVALDVMAPGAVVSPESLKLLRREVEANLQEARDALETDRLRVTTHVREGDPAAEVVHAAEEIRPDVVVVGSRGRGALARWALGSVSTALVHHWRGPVLVVRNGD